MHTPQMTHQLILSIKRVLPSSLAARTRVVGLAPVRRFIDSVAPRVVPFELGVAAVGAAFAGGVGAEVGAV